MLPFEISGIEGMIPQARLWVLLINGRQMKVRLVIGNCPQIPRETLMQMMTFGGEDRGRRILRRRNI